MSLPVLKSRPAPVRGRRKSESAPRPALESSLGPSLSTALSKPASPKEAWTKPSSPKPASKNGTKKLRPAPVRHRTINSVTTNGSHSASHSTSHSGTRKKKKPPRRASVNNVTHVNNETTERKKFKEKIKREAESRLAELKRETEIIKQKIQERKALQEKENMEMLNYELDKMSHLAESTEKKTLKNRKEENKIRKMKDSMKKREEMRALFDLYRKGQGTSMNQDDLSATDNKELGEEISRMIAKQYKSNSEKWAKTMKDTKESEDGMMYMSLMKGRQGRSLNRSR
jgi:hypothetical protein